MLPSSKSRQLTDVKTTASIAFEADSYIPSIFKLVLLNELLILITTLILALTMSLIDL